MLFGLRRYFDEHNCYGLLLIDIRKRIGGVNIGRRMSFGGLVNMSERIRVLNNNRVYRTVCL